MAFQKYNAKRIEKAGRSFGSGLESSVHDILLLRQRAGEIDILKLQDTVLIECPPNSKNRWRCIPDFKCQYRITSEIFWVEAKGMDTDRWKATLFLWRAFGPGRMEIWRGHKKKPYLSEIVDPARIRVDQLFKGTV